MSILNEEQIIDVDEVCTNCAHCAGPIILQCVNPNSEFCGGPVHPEGWCYGFKHKRVQTAGNGAQAQEQHEC